MLSAGVLSLTSASVSSAAIVAYEGFDFTGSDNTSANGNAGATSTGFSGNWADRRVVQYSTDSYHYFTSGLTFGGLQTTGGLIETYNGNSGPFGGDDASEFGRTVNANAVPGGSTIDGSYLVHFVGGGAVDRAGSLIANSIYDKEDGGGRYLFAGATDYGQGGRGAIRTQAVNQAGNAGTPIPADTTFMVLYNVSNADADSTTANTHSVSEYVFKPGPIHLLQGQWWAEREPRIASVGTGDGQVYQANTVSSTSSIFLNGDILSFFANNGGVPAQFDELRVGTGGFDEVTPTAPTPEPASLSAIAISAAALLRRRRHR